MKLLIQFLSDLRMAGITLTVDGDRIVVSAPKGAVTAAIRDELIKRKQEILAFLGDSTLSSRAEKRTSVLVDLPLSRSQRRLWFMSQLYPESPVYNIVLGLRVAGALDLAALERVLRALLERHEALRTSFYERNGTPLSRVNETAGWSSSLVDMSDLAESDASDAAIRLAREEARKPFALDTAPLFRATIYRITEHHHLLLLVVHHIVADGWSLGVLAKEFTELYDAFTTNRQPALAPIAFEYRDYVQWEQASGEETAAQQMPYWSQHLEGPLPILELPSDRRRPAVQAFDGQRLFIDIDLGLASQIKDLCRSTATTPFMVLLAAFDVLVSRYTGLEDILIGAPTSNRQRQEVTPLIGFFVNNLVLRTDVSGNPRFIDLLSRVKETALSAYAHQDMPFDRLVEQLAPDRGLGHSPLVQIMFTLQNVPMSDIVLPGLIVKPVPIDPGIARSDLAVEVWPLEGGYRCDFEYNSDLFEEATIRQMQGNFVRLLQSAVNHPEMTIDRLTLLSEQEHRQLINYWRSPATPALPYASLPEWFRGRAAKSPGAIAVEMGPTALSYSELDAESDRMASALRARGIARGSVVGVYLKRSPQMVVALLAVLKAGAAYLPIDPMLPAQRVEFLLADAQVPLILVDAELKASLPASNTAVLAMDEVACHSLTATEATCGNPGAEDTAYLIYTSGSTGAPKGTRIPHRALVNLLDSMLREPGLDATDTLVAITTLSFDIAGLEMFGPLVCGAKLVIASREQTVDPALLAALLEQTCATVMQATPSTWRMLVESGWMGSADLRMWCGGEALPSELAENLLSRGRELWNLYGPTETTIWSAAHRVKSGEDPILIGRPIANTSMYVLDANLQPVPLGVPGELYIGGEGVALGYWNRDELTASHFVEDPFALLKGKKMYRTGDLARFHRNGQIQLLGRVDHQIKLRGHRIELGEIEVALERHPDVFQAVVALSGEGSEQQLTAYIRYQSEEDDSGAVRNWLQERLPDYMVPSTWIALKEIPLTPNGKVDRKRLPAPPSVKRRSSAGGVNPRNHIESTLAAIWGEVLGVEQVGMRDNFFDLGGHSLRLIRVHARVRESLGCDVAVIDLFRYPTIESLALWLADKRPQMAEATGA
ncbi:MAG: amino acid adenylation domain-containing protein [Acidobacteria bacterium]|nr:amino acid adenylation domain-containing protein [Acidobacteriota bacterium]